MDNGGFISSEAEGRSREIAFRKEMIKSHLSRRDPQEVSEPSVDSGTENGNSPEEIDKVRQAARRAILQDVKRARIRAEKIGPQGWKKSSCLSTNKAFLGRTIRATLRLQPRSGKYSKANCRDCLSPR